MSASSRTPPSEMRTYLRPMARAIDLATEVLPTPGGPTKSRIGPLAALSSGFPGTWVGASGLPGTGAVGASAGAAVAATTVSETSAAVAVAGASVAVTATSVAVAATSVAVAATSVAVAGAALAMRG